MRFAHSTLPLLLSSPQEKETVTYKTQQSMNRQIKNVVKRLALKPKNVFLIDGVGAVVTAILLMAVLKPFNKYVGMPPNVLTSLSITAFIFAGYSFCCYLFLGNRLPKLLTPIIVANISYCVFTFALIIYFYNSLTLTGLIYFIAELLLIAFLVSMELILLKVVDEQSKSQ